MGEVGQTSVISRAMLLEAGVDDEPLSCSIVTVNVGRCPPFEALSYTWGHGTAAQPIQCNGGAIPITPNLKTCLRELRRPTQARRLCIDAICIDHQNVEERDWQMRHVRLIYKHATRVIVWYGLDGPGTREAMELADRIYDNSIPYDPTKRVEKGVELQRNTQMLLHIILDAEDEAINILPGLFDHNLFCLLCVCPKRLGVAMVYSTIAKRKGTTPVLHPK